MSAILTGQAGGIDPCLLIPKDRQTNKVKQRIEVSLSSYLDKVSKTTEFPYFFIF